MDQEQTERALNFILEQMGRFAAGLEALRYQQQELQAAQRQTQAQLDRLTAVLETTVGLVNRHSLQIERLASSLAELRDLQRHTDGRLNIVISELDRVTRHLGGQSPQP